MQQKCFLLILCKFTAVRNISPKFPIGKPNFKDNLRKVEFDFEFPRSFLDFVRHRDTMRMFGIAGHLMYVSGMTASTHRKLNVFPQLILRQQSVSGSALLTIRTSRIDSAQTRCKLYLLLVSWMCSVLTQSTVNVIPQMMTKFFGTRK